MNRQEWQDLMGSCRSMFPTQDIPPATADSWYMAAGQRWDSDMAMAGLIRLSKTLDRRLTLAAWTSAVELEVRNAAESWSAPEVEVAPADWATRWKQISRRITSAPRNDPVRMLFRELFENGVSGERSLPQLELCAAQNPDWRSDPSRRRIGAIPEEA